MSEPEIRAKGLTFLSVVGALEEMRGPLFARAVVQRMPGEAGEALRANTVLAASWYPISWYRELHRAAVEESGDLGFPREVGKVSTRRDVKGVHRLLFRVMSTELLMKQGPRFFKMFFDPTDVKILQIGAGMARTRYERCVGFDRNLWLEQLGGCEELLTLAGARHPRVRVVSGGQNGDSFMELESSWR